MNSNTNILNSILAIYLKKNSILQLYIDGIRVLADPYIKHSAHISIQGPYTKKKITKNKIQVENKISSISKPQILLEGVGDFFFNSNTQNTVFLKSKSLFLTNPSIWKKPSFKNPKLLRQAHLTIYDGKSRNFAAKLIEIFERYPFHLKLERTDYYIQILKRIPKMPNEAISFDFSKDFTQTFCDYDFISKELDEKITWKLITEMSIDERIRRIDILCKKLYDYQESLKTASCQKNNTVGSVVYPTLR